MNTSIPIFNYSPQLYDEVLKAGLIVSECSVLRLLCFHQDATSVMQKLAIANFDYWLKGFLKSSNVVFNSGLKADKEGFSVQYIEFVLSYALVAALYDYRTFIPLDQLNMGSFIKWEHGRLVRVRLLSALL